MKTIERICGNVLVQWLVGIAVNLIAAILTLALLSGCAPGTPEMVQGIPVENAVEYSGGLPTGGQTFWDYPCPGSTLVIHDQTEPTMSKKYIENLCEYYK